MAALTCLVITGLISLFGSLAACTEATDGAIPPMAPSAPMPAQLTGDSLQLLEQAARTTPERYAAALAKGARILPTLDGRSFWVVWTPDGETIGSRPVVVSLHGHGSWALDEFAMWQESLAARGYALAALQWWFGGGESKLDYYLPAQAYPQVEALLREEGVGQRQALLHGFSRGAANSYAIAFLDVHSGGRFFAAVLANAGGASADFPPNVEIASGAHGAAPFAGTKWLLYCGMNDAHPDRDGCDGMTRTAAWLTGLGGAVDLFLRDPSGNHGGFHRNDANVSKALDTYADLMEHHKEFQP